MLKYNKNLFSKNRCGIFSCSNPKLLFKSRKKISIIFSKLGFQLHPKSFEKTSQEKLNSFMQNINKELGPLSLDIINSFSKPIKLFIGSKIAIQKKPYIRINCKHLASTATIPHTDVDFGLSPFGFNIWVPLFDVFGKSGIYVYSFLESKLIYKNFKFDKRLDEHIDFLKRDKKFFKKNNLKKFFFKPSFYEAIILSNCNVHGAVNDKNFPARISLNLHFQNAKVPYGEKGAEFFKFASFDNNNKRYKIISA